MPHDNAYLGPNALVQAGQCAQQATPIARSEHHDRSRTRRTFTTSRLPARYLRIDDACLSDTELRPISSVVYCAVHDVHVPSEYRAMCSAPWCRRATSSADAACARIQRSVW